MNWFHINHLFCFFQQNLRKEMQMYQKYQS